MSDIHLLLKELGINEKASKTYLALLELGSGTVQEVAERASIKRTSVYNFLEELKKFGLVTEVIEKNRSLLVAEDPAVLKVLAEQKLNQAKEYERKVNIILPDLLSRFSLPGNKPKVTYYRGVEGIKKVYEDTIKTGETIYAFSDYEKMFEAMSEEFMFAYADRRAVAKIKFYSIGPDGPWTQKVLKKSPEQNREMKIVKKIKFDTEINIYGNKVAMISFRRPYIGVIVEDRAIAETLRAIWKNVWENN